MAGLRAREGWEWERDEGEAESSAVVFWWVARWREWLCLLSLTILRPGAQIPRVGEFGCKRSSAIG